jgi:hypothetical protein
MGRIMIKALNSSRKIIIKRISLLSVSVLATILLVVVLSLLAKDLSSILTSILVPASFVLGVKFVNILMLDKKSNLYLLPFLYMALTFFIAIMYASNMFLAGVDIKINPTPSLDETELFFRYIYFATISLTSVGYGEYHPIDTDGQWLAISMALVGTANMITFISLTASNFSKENPETKDSEVREPAD